MRDVNGPAARVAGDTGVTQPRTVEAGVILSVALVRPAATPPVSDFLSALSGRNAVFMTRTNNAHDALPTAC